MIRKVMKEIPEDYAEVFEFYLDKETVKKLSFAKEVFFGKHIFFRLKKSLESLFGNIQKRRSHQVKPDPTLEGGRWVVAGTRNQENCMKFLLEDQKYQLVQANFYQSANGGSPIDWYPRSKFSYLKDYAGLFWNLLRADSKHFFKVFHLLIHGVGVLENHRVVLQRYKPELIVMSNDHLPWFRALTVAARELSVPTVYLQHACVSEVFPPLRNDLSLLDGQDALDKYRAGGKQVSGRVALVGMAKYDAYRKLRNESLQVSKVSFPFNQTDSISAIRRLVTTISKTFPELAITLRKHPRDTRPFPTIPGVEVLWSDARAVPALEYLRSQDMIIAGETSIHLEAAMMNVTSVYYNLRGHAEDTVDYYGFIANGLIEEANSEEELLAIIREQMKHRAPPESKLEYYIANHGNQETSGERARKEILQLLEDRQADL